LLYGSKPPDMLYPIYVGTEDMTLSGTVTMAGGGDSFYEYVLKYWIATGKGEQVRGIGRWYYEMADSFIDNLGIRFNQTDRFAFYEMAWGQKSPKFGHLACFSGAMFAP